METAGIIVGVAGLAGLFSSCLEAVDKVQSFLTFGADSHALETRFKAIRVRFERWGPDVGIKQGRLSDDHHAALDDKDVFAAAEDILRIIKTICDTGDSRDAPRRRTRVVGLGNDGGSVLQRRSALPGGASESTRRKLAWALWGKESRTEQVELFGKLVRELHELVPPDTGNGMRPTYEPDARRTDTLAISTTSQCWLEAAI